MLAFGHRHALARTQFIERLARQLAVARKLAHRKVHVAVVGLVGQRLGLQPPDELEHLRHVFGGLGLDGRRLDAQGRDVLVHGPGHFGGELTDGDAPLDRPLDDLVVDVGDVAHIGHAQATGLEPSLNHVKSHHHAGMADVAQVINGHAAHIHAHMAGLQRGKIFHGTRQRVVDA